MVQEHFEAAGGVPQHPETFTREETREFEMLRVRLQRMASAWDLKETAMAIFDLKASPAARRNFAIWFKWAIRSQPEPIKREARTLLRH